MRYLWAAVALCCAGTVCLILFALLVWPPLALGVLGAALIVAGLVVDVPKRNGPTPPAPPAPPRRR